MGAGNTLLFFLTARWSSPIDFSHETMEGARARAEGIREIFRNPSEPAPAGALGALRGDARRRLQHARRARARTRVARPRPRAACARRLRARLARRDDQAPAELDELARRRQQAREDRDFAGADRLRAEIEAAGWEVRDDPDGYRLVPKQ